MDVATLFDDVKRMNKRQFFYQVLSFGMIVSSALMIWKGLMVVTGSESPIVVVLSGGSPSPPRNDHLNSQFQVAWNRLSIGATCSSSPTTRRNRSGSAKLWSLKWRAATFPSSTGCSNCMKSKWGVCRFGEA